MDSWDDSETPVPPELEPWLPAFEWSREKLCALDLPVDELPLAELAWLLDLPLWRTEEGDVFRIRPLDVVDGWHLERTNAADLDQPLDVTWHNGRYVVLDGVHRLLKAARTGRPTVRVRVVTGAALPAIAA